jgi:hypothetical protein
MPQFSPSALAVAVMSLLCFGVVIGAEVSPPSNSAARVPVRVALASPATSARTPGAGEHAATAGAASGAASTQTPSSSAASATGGAGSTAPTSRQKSNQGAPTSSTPPAGSSLPPIRHVFVIVLGDQGYNQGFNAGPSAPYLSQKLPAKGELFDDYYAVDSGELANEIALVSGQGPTAELEGNCPLYSEIAPGTLGAEGQVIGHGCVYPRPTLTIANQLTAVHKTWRAYIEGEGKGPGDQGATCTHPRLETTDPNQSATAGDAYVTWRNPFVYFESLTSTTACATNDVGVGRLAHNLKRAATTPSFAYIAPDPCRDGAEAPCTPGAAAGLAPAEAFLRRVVPEIEASPAYAEGGLIAITFDQAPQSGANADSTGCCFTGAYPNPRATSTTTTTASTAPLGAAGVSGTTSTTTTVSATSTGAGSAAEGETPGGGRVGLLLISKYIKPGTRELTGQYSHFSLLRSIENLFGLKPLGYAGQPGVLAFDKAVFNAYK